MAIYHCSIKIIGRSDGKSAVDSSAYRSGEKLMDDRTGLIHDFTKKRGVVFTKISLPAHENQKLREENTTLKELLEKAYEFMKQFVINGVNLLERFLESVGKVVGKIR